MNDRLTHIQEPDDDSLADAQIAMDEYNSGYAAGGEPDFPQWAWNLIQTQKRDIRRAA